MPNAQDAYDQVVRTGCRVFPIPYGSKKPNIPDWRNAATDDAKRIFEMWMADNHNIGTVVSPKLYLYDADEFTVPGAIAFTREMIRHQGFDPDKLMHFITASNGEHFPFRTPYPIATKIRHFGQGAGVDIIGYGSQFIGAPSVVIYPDGRIGEYKVVNDGVTIPMATPSMLAQLIPYEDRKARVVTGDIPELDNIADVLGFKSVIAATPLAIEGQGGNDRTYRLACEGRDSGLSEDTVLACISNSPWNANSQPPWQFEELAELVANAFRYGRSSQGSKSVGSLFAGVVPPPPVSFANGHTAIPPLHLPVPPMNPGSGPAYVPLGDDWALRFSQDTSDLPWIAHDLLMRGEISACAAHGGTGKGMLVAAIATRLVVGGNFGPWHFHGGARVVLLSYEERYGLLGHKLLGQIERHGMDKKAVLDGLTIVNAAKYHIKLTRAERNGAVIVDEAVADLVARLKAIRTDVLVVDPLQFLGDGDMNASHIAGSLMQALMRVADEAGIAILFMHHVAKGDRTNSLRGSTVLSANTRLIYGLERSEEYEGHNVVDIAMAKTNLGPFDNKHHFMEIVSHPLTPSLSTGVMVDSGYASQEISKNRRELRNFVADRLANGEDCADGTLSQIIVREWLIETRGISKNTAYRQIEGEFDEGVAVRMTDGNYVTRKKKAGGAFFFAYSDEHEIQANAVKFNRPPEKIEDLL